MVDLDSWLPLICDHILAICEWAPWASIPGCRVRLKPDRS